MKLLSLSDFRARRYMLEKKDFAMASGRYGGPTNLIDKATWKSIVSLPDDVSIRTSDKYGGQLETMWDYWGMWTRVIGGVQALSKKPQQSAMAIAALDACDEFQAATYAALVGYYRVAFSCLRNVLEQMTIATQLTLSQDPKDFTDWRGGDERIKFGWACDFLQKNAVAAGLELHLKTTTKDTLLIRPLRDWLADSFDLSQSTHTGHLVSQRETCGKATGRSSCPKPSLNGVLRL